MSSIPDAQPARPWRTEDGPEPEVWTWPRTDRSALEVMAGGRWRHVQVLARRTGTTALIDLHGDTTIRILAYQWPQPGLRVARRGNSQPSRSVGKD
ncbi:hypothetical protein ACIRP3_43010 [Streptomyces sp. NPDC101209]|uniref:hypothetical protein n=1 Tax=Streptomyces sp. NPDC101209 TaxID=3366129 RepID=UPI0037FDFF8A